MRPQGFGQVGLGVGMEDLGWNDMGQAPQAPAPDYTNEELPEHVPSSIAALTPAPRGHVEPVQDVEQEQEEDVPPPPVVEQQRAIEATFAEPTRPAPVAPVAVAPLAVAPVIAAPAVTASVVPLLPRERRAPGSKAKAAFTLRLDAERHLKLRLACAVTHRSAQQLVTEALDQFLATLPELDALSSSVTAKAGKRN
jgi:hypothetical protein